MQTSYHSPPRGTYQWYLWNLKVKTATKIKQLVWEAVSKGLIQKSNCIKCGNPQVQGHHEDYTKPLDVKWLCCHCHNDLHRIDKIISWAEWLTLAGVEFESESDWLWPDLPKKE